MVQIKNAPKNYKREDILARAVGVIDSNGVAARWITLDRSTDKPVTGGSTTYGFDSTIIEIGRNGMTITHRPNGYVEWHIDPLSGRAFTVVGYTKNNLRLIAACLGDKMYRVREAEIAREVEIIEQEIMAELKEKRVHVMGSDGKLMYDHNDEPVTVSAYDNLIEQRKQGRKVQAGVIFDPRKAEPSNELALEQERQQRLVEQLRKQNAELEMKLAIGNQTRQQLLADGVITEIIHSREELEAMKPFSALKRLARDEYKISEVDVENMSKADLVNQIMNIQEQRKLPERVE